MYKILTITLTTAFILTTSIFGVLATAQKVNAVDVLQQPCTNGAAASSSCQDNSKVQGGGNPIFGPNGILTEVVNILSYIVGVASIVVIIIAGIRMAISGGDSSAVAGARNSILYALIGVAVAATAQILVAFVLNKVQ